MNNVSERERQPSPVCVALCGRLERVPEAALLQTRLLGRGYNMIFRDSLDGFASELSSRTLLSSGARLVVLAHFPSLVGSPTDIRSHQGMLIAYKRLKQTADSNGVRTNLIVFGPHGEGPMAGGWDYPISATVRQETEILEEWIVRAVHGKLKDYGDQ